MGTIFLVTPHAHAHAGDYVIGAVSIHYVCIHVCMYVCIYICDRLWENGAFGAIIKLEISLKIG